MSDNLGLSISMHRVSNGKVRTKNQGYVIDARYTGRKFPESHNEKEALHASLKQCKCKHRAKETVGKHWSFLLEGMST